MCLLKKTHKINFTAYNLSVINMQYDRNDEIIYDEGFTTSTEREYYSPIEHSGAEQTTAPESNTQKTKPPKTYPTVLITQLVVCVLCAVFLYVSKEYLQDIYTVVMENISSLINDSLVVDGNDLNDYFVKK